MDQATHRHKNSQIANEFRNLNIEHKNWIKNRKSQCCGGVGISSYFDKNSVKYCERLQN